MRQSFKPKHYMIILMKDTNNPKEGMVFFSAEEAAHFAISWRHGLNPAVPDKGMDGRTRIRHKIFHGYGVDDPDTVD